jgi:prepilin-type N-terminal cleavage/methylation domain-containing protein
MKMNPTRRRGFTLVELLVVIVIIAALAGLTAPMVIKQRKKADQTEAVSNARQVGLALFEFDTAYGSFPDASTADTVKENTETSLNLGNSNANDYFRQLIAAEIATSETIFYCKTAFSKKPDNVFNSDRNALSAGEVGFGYIMNGQDALSTAGNPARPVICAPLAYPFNSGEFDADLYDSKAVLLKLDNSVESVQILRQSKRAQLRGGKHILATGPDTVWDTLNPRIENPDPKGASGSYVNKAE